MAAADCAVCAAMGYRSCDRCGGVVFVPHPVLGDLCEYCLGTGEDRPPSSNTGATR